MKNLTYDEAIEEVLNELLALSDAEFRKALDAHENGDFANMLRETSALQARKESADLLDQDLDLVSLDAESHAVGVSVGISNVLIATPTPVFPYTYLAQGSFLIPGPSFLTSVVIDTNMPSVVFPLESRSSGFINFVTTAQLNVGTAFGGNVVLSTPTVRTVLNDEVGVVFNRLTETKAMHFSIRTDDVDEEECAA